MSKEQAEPVVESTPEVAAPETTTQEQAAAPEVIDWSFKFNDEVKEVPEEYRGWVKEKTQAEKLKDIYQRAEAVEYHKKMTGEFKNKLTTLEQQYGEAVPVVEQVRKLQELYSNQDDERVMEILGYSKERILKLAEQMLKRDQMDPEQKKLYDEKKQYTLAQEQLMRQNQEYRQQASQQMAELTSMQLDAELGRAEVQTVARAYDDKFGAGKFRDLVIAQGEAMVARLGRHVPPHELIPQVVSHFMPFIQGGVGTQPQQANVAEAAPKPKVIPNIKGNSASVGRSAINSIADLKKKRQEILGG